MLRKADCKTAPHVVTCDRDPYKERYPGEPVGCGERFTSYSAFDVVERQAFDVGWSLKNPAHATRKDRQHLCPMHSEPKHKRVISPPSEWGTTDNGSTKVAWSPL